ncbi:hypothetical protein M2150_001663 [Lachnospiraceae bacterium PM6-15]|uniref:SpaA isopeptide-forming pilin-related protein n=1 Tax=Ohessyouella blattaphilus TaxID=2949333 RepID=UPI003E27D039
MNKKKKSILTRLMSLVAVIAMLFTMITPMGVMAKEKTPEEVLEDCIIKKKARSSDSVSYSIGEQLPYHDVFTNVFSGTVNGNSGEVYCMNPSKIAPSGGSYTIDYIDNSSALAKAMYYLYGGPGFSQGPIAGVSDPNTARIYTHLAVSYLLDKNADWWFGMKEDGLKQGIIDIANNIETQQPSAPSSFRAYVFNLYQPTQAMIGSYNIPQGKLTLKKESANPNITDGNRCYSLKGAVYEVMNSSNAVVGQLVTDESGKANTLSLDVGNYTVKEKTAPSGYALDPNVYPISIKSNQETVVNGGVVKDIPQNDPINIWVGKIDLETTLDMPQGSASLAGAEFTIKFYDVVYGEAEKEVDPATKGEKPLRTWIVKTNENGYSDITREELFVSGDELFKDSFGQPTLPRGTATIEETKAPEGYLLNDSSVHVRQILTDGSSLESVETYDTPVIKEQIKRGDFEFNKIADYSAERMKNVKWEIVSDTTGERDEFVNDENGYYSSASDFVAHDAENGLWFGEKTALDNGKGALPYDTYTINELRCEANEGYKLLKGIKLVISRDNYVVKMGTLTNDKDVEPSIETLFVTTEGDKVFDPRVDQTLVDEVKQTVPESKLDTELFYVTQFHKVDKDGKETVVGEVESSHTSKEQVENFNIEFDYKAGTLLDGEKLVATHITYTDKEHKDEYIRHYDLENEDQTLVAVEPKIETLFVTTDGKQEFDPTVDQKLVDKVKQTVPDGKVGTELFYVTQFHKIDKDGKETVMGEVVDSYTSKTTEETFEVVFEYKAGMLADGEKLVATHIAYLDEEHTDEYVRHYDLENEKQTLVAKTPSTPEEPTKMIQNVQTGDKTFLLILGAFLLVGGIVAFFLGKRKK